MTNEQLMESYIKGDAKAFEELFERIHQRVFFYVCKNLSDKNEQEDVTQNIFIKIHTSKEKYNSIYPFDAWLFTIARSVLYDHLRKNSKIKLEEFKDFKRDEEPLARDIDETMACLPLKMRKVVELKYMDEMTFEEIAQRIHTSPSNVRQIVSRAIRFLRKNNKELT